MEGPAVSFPRQEASLLIEAKQQLRKLIWESVIPGRSDYSGTSSATSEKWTLIVRSPFVIPLVGARFRIGPQSATR